MIGHSFKTMWTAVRYFVLGIAAALLYAPRSGSESRKVMRDSILGAFDKVLPTSNAHNRDDVGELDKQHYWESDAPPEQNDVMKQVNPNSNQHPVL